LVLASCADNSNKERKPIVLGDSSTIITETDPAYLTDFVSDIQLQEVPKDTVVIATKAPDTVVSDQPKETTIPDEAARTTAQKGLNIPFGEVTVFIPDIKVKSYRQQDLNRVNGVSYQLTDGSLSGNQLRLSGGTIQKVSQRYISGVIAKSSLGSLILDALSNTAAWVPLRGNDNVYSITGLEPNQLTARKASPAQIRAAVSRAAKNKRLSKKDIRKWEASVRNIRSLNQRPFVIVLKSVMWKIDGKDAQGKSFSKQVRIDMPSL
jgi:hypothetical protein